MLTSQDYEFDITTIPSDFDVCEIIDKKLLSEKIKEVMATLTIREADVLYLRIWEELTLKEIGEKYNINRERIGFIQTKALRKMRHGTRYISLRYFLPDIDRIEEQLRKDKEIKEKNIRIQQEHVEKLRWFLLNEKREQELVKDREKRILEWEIEFKNRKIIEKCGKTAYRLKLQAEVEKEKLLRKNMSAEEKHIHCVLKKRINKLLPNRRDVLANTSTRVFEGACSCCYQELILVTRKRKIKAKCNVCGVEFTLRYNPKYSFKIKDKNKAT